MKGSSWSGRHTQFAIYLIGRRYQCFSEVYPSSPYTFKFWKWSLFLSELLLPNKIFLFGKLYYCFEKNNIKIYLLKIYFFSPLWWASFAVIFQWLGLAMTAANVRRNLRDQNRLILLSLKKLIGKLKQIANGKQSQKNL